MRCAATKKRKRGRTVRVRLKNAGEVEMRLNNVLPPGLLRRAAKTLVIGYGNTMRRDDGAGPAVVEWLQELVTDDRGVEAIACFQLTPELAEQVSQAGQVVFVDASVALKAGDVEVRRARPRGDVDGGVGHRVSPELILMLAEALYGRGPVAWTVAIGVKNLAIGDRLSELVELRAREVAAWLAEELTR